MKKIFLHPGLVLAVALLLSGIQGMAQQNNIERDIALEYFRNREYEKALPLFEKLWDANPSDFHYHYFFHCLIETRDFKKAEKAARRQVKASKNNQRFEVDLGYALLAGGEIEKGKKVFDDIIKSLPSDRRIINDIANAFISRRENDYAIKTYMRGRELLNDANVFQMELGNLYDRLGNFEKMVDEYLNVLRTDITNLSQIQTRFQNALFGDSEGKRGQFLRTSLLRNIRLYPDVTAYSELMLWFSIQQGDFESAYLQSVALDRRLNENGNKVFSIAQLSMVNKNYDVAIKAFEYLIARGPENQFFLNSRIEILKAESKRLTSRYPIDQQHLMSLEKRYDETLKELGKNRFTIGLIRDLANLYAFMFYNTEKAISLLNEALGIPGIGQQNIAECKLDLADILLYSGDVWEATLLYSQVEKEFPSEPIGHEAKLRNARLSFFIGEFEWARAQLDVLKAATSKLIANDAMALSLLIKDNMEPDSTYEALTLFAQAELHSYRNRDDLALQVFDSLMKKFPYHMIHDDVYFRKAEISIRMMKYTEATDYLKKIIELYPNELLADKALYRLGEVYEVYLNDSEKAMQYYKELMLNYPASLQVTPARQRFRSLRGDVI